MLSHIHHYHISILFFYSYTSLHSLYLPGTHFYFVANLFPKKSKFSFCCCCLFPLLQKMHSPLCPCIENGLWYSCNKDFLQSLRCFCLSLHTINIVFGVETPTSCRKAPYPEESLCCVHAPVWLQLDCHQTKKFFQPS